MRGLAGAWTAVCLASCCSAGPVGVVVTDPEGRPVEGARITGLSPSYNGQTLLTDRDGESRIPWALNPTAWITVEKEGFVPTRNVPVDTPRPIRVVLQPSGLPK